MAQPIEVRDMRIVHRTFRNAYEESARLVRAAPTPSAGRVTFLADHIDFGFGMIPETLDDADRAYMKSHLPLPVRILYPILIQRPWTKYATTLRAGS